MSLKMQFCICLVSESNSPLIKSIASGLSFIGILFLFLFSSSAITDAARILCLIAHTLLASDQPLLGGKTSTLQWKRRLKHCNERAQFSSIAMKGLKSQALQWKSSGLNLRNHLAAWPSKGGIQSCWQKLQQQKRIFHPIFLFSALYFFPPCIFFFFPPCISFFPPSISFLLIPRRRNAPPQFGRRGGVPAEEAKIS